MAEARRELSERFFYNPLPAGERAGARSAPGEGLTRRGTTPKQLLAWAKEMRHQPTPQEEQLWQQLRAKRLDGWKFRHQSPIGPFIPDFCCPEAKLIIELDGSQHAERAGYDESRTEFLKDQGYRVLRVWNSDVDQHLDGVLMLIREALSAPLPAQASPESPSPPQGEGN